MERRKGSLTRIRVIANYQFESDVGYSLFPEETKITFSKKTGRPRHFSLDGNIIATFKPNDGFLSLSLAGAMRLASALPSPRFRVIVREDVARFIAEGGDVFARHVTCADPKLRAGEETLVMSPSGEVVAIGKALLTGKEMIAFNRGVAVKVRKGVSEIK
jgi:uncharacterized protein with predicted RNA binding PUA domain